MMAIKFKNFLKAIDGIYILEENFNFKKPAMALSSLHFRVNDGKIVEISEGQQWQKL